MDIQNINTILVVGAGVMGHGIAQIFAQAGFNVTMMDRDKQAIKRGLELIQSSLSVQKKNGLIKTDAIEKTIERIKTTTVLSAAAKDVDFVIEAVSEKPEIKKEVFRELDGVCTRDTIFASNTSGLDIFNLAGMSQPTHLLATHFFAPAQIIPLVEVCPGPETLPEIVDGISQILKMVGKQPIVMKQFVPSFIVNRIQNYIGMAVFEMLNNNWATPEEIDQAVKLSLGVRLPIVGVLQTMDFTGLDLVNDITKTNGVSIPVIEDLVCKGHLGAKTGKGFFDYQGRSEEEIIEKRDTRYIKMIQALNQLDAFEPV